MNVASAAGLGEYKIGRRGQPTRLEINKVALRNFIETDHEEKNNGSDDVSTEHDANPPTGEVAPMVENLSRPQIIGGTSGGLSLHIDIQIHIDSDATPEQIDKIFESMAKHLYRNSGE